MINLCFLLEGVSDEWIGGLNYYKNLLIALNILQDKEIIPIVFLSKKTPVKTKHFFSQYAKTIELSILDRYSPSWIVWKFTKKILNSDIYFEFYIKKFAIDIISHSYVWGFHKIKTINWIPDFQHIYLPDFFPEKEIKKRNNQFRNLAKKSDIVLLSSYNAQKDYNNFTQHKQDNSAVLQFTVKVNGNLLENHEAYEQNILNKHSISTPYFYLPNQFWAHKNHITVLKAIYNLKKNGHNITLVCSGSITDYRNKEHINEINAYIALNNLSSIFLLGIIDHDDVIVLMKRSLAVINPSKFEGWSTTVEECKTLEKLIILSDINVHKEQNPKHVIYFNADDYKHLSEIMLKLWEAKTEATPHVDTEYLTKRNEDNIKDFAKTYQQIIINLYRSQKLDN